MRKLKTIASLAILGIGIAVAPLSLAHHSAVAFDKTKTQVVKGTVTRFIWRNPHLSVQLDVTADDGSTEEWRIEGGSTREMVANGFDREGTGQSTEERRGGRPDAGADPGRWQDVRHGGGFVCRGAG
jgi:hypothetical protein